MDDEIIARIAPFKSPRGSRVAERRNRGYTLYEAHSGAPVARLRPTKLEGHFEVLHWSLWKERWSSTGPFGSTVIPLDEAIACIAAQDIFWVST